MKDLHEFLILLSLIPIMLVIRWLFDRHFKVPDDTDVYTLSDERGNRVKILVKKLATAKEREEILAERLRELFQQRSG